MLANLLIDVNGRAFPLVKVIDVSQLLIALRAERRSDGFCAVGDHVFVAWVWNILLMSEPVEWPVAGVLGIGCRRGYSGLSRTGGWWPAMRPFAIAAV